MKQIIFYTALNGRAYAQEWLYSLSNKQDRIKILSRLERAKKGNFGDYKSLGKDLYELRFHNGMRLYYTTHKNTLIVLFKGGNKQGQSKDIAKARELLAEYKANKEGLYE